MTINYSKQVLVKRGNTEVSATYTGPLGEITYDTDLHQLRVHDGDKVGGWIVPGGPEYELLLPLIANAASQQDQINSLLANAIAQQTSLDNLVTEGNVDPGTGNETFWFNTEDGRLYIKWQDMWIDSNPTELPSPSYITGVMEDFAGNIIPAANVTYSLGTQEAQWKDLWVSNNTIYIGNTPITVSNGNLLVNGNTVTGGGATDRLVSGDQTVVLDADGVITLPADAQIRVVPILGDNGPGTNLYITAGNTQGSGQPGGNTILSAGLGYGGYNSGNVEVRTGDNYDHRWEFDATGNLILPVGGDIVDRSGHSVLGGVGASTGNITFDDVTIRGTTGTLAFQSNIDRPDLTWTIMSGDEGGLGVSILSAPQGDDQHVGEIVFSGTDGGGTLAYVGAVGTPFDNAFNLIAYGTDTNVKISTGNGDWQWNFDNTGNLTMPGNLITNSNLISSYSIVDNYIIVGPDHENGTPFSSPAALFYGNTYQQPPSYNYYQMILQNTDSAGSACYKISADDGNETANWIAMGINGSNYSDPQFPTALPHDGYLTLDGGNLNVSSIGGSILFNTIDGSLKTTEVTQEGNWIFPNNIIVTGNILGTTSTGPVTITSNDGSSDRIWTFGTDGKLTAPGKIQTTDTTNSISTTTGALIVGGGAGIHSDVHIGGTVNITDTTPSTDYTTGALVVAGGVGVNGNINLTGNINILNGNINIQEFTGSTGNFYGDVVTGFNAFYAGKSGFTALPYTVAQFSTASNTYSQINMENTSTGKLASADFVGTADLGTDSSWFFDIGIANSGYDPVLAAQNNAPGTSVQPLDTYFYVQGNVDVPNTGGNLTIGTSQTGKVVKFIAGGTDTANVVMTIKENSVVVAQNLTAPNLGYAVDVAAANAAIVTANSAVVSYVNTLNSAMGSRVDAANAAIVTANSAVVSYVNTLNSAMGLKVDAANASITTANTAMKSYVDAQIAGVPGGGGTTYSNANVVAYYTSSNNFSVANVVTTHLLSNSQSIMLGNLTTFLNGGLQQINTYVANNVGWWANGYPYSIRSGGGSYLSMGGGTTTLTGVASGTANTAFAGATIFNAGSGYFNLFQTLTFQPGANIGVNNVGSVIGITANLAHTGSNFVTSSNVLVAGNVTVNGINGVRMPNRPAFRVYGTSSGQIVAPATISSTHGATVDFNQGSYYNNATGVFTAPVAGLYHAYATLRVGTNNGMNQATIVKNDSTVGANVVAFWETDTNTGTAVHFSMTGYAQCVAGDTLRLKVLSGNVNLDSNDSWGVTYLG